MIDFGSIESGTTATAQTVTLTNAGSQHVTVTVYSEIDSVHFPATLPTPATIAAAGTETISVAFMPDALGTVSSSITVTHDARGPSTISLTGSGQAVGGTNNAASFDGSTGYISTSHFADLSAFTVSAWVKLSAWDGTSQYLIAGAGAGSPQLILNPQSGAPAIQFYDGFNFPTVVSPNVLPAGVWTHLAATFVAGTMRLYENGVLVGSSTPASSPALNTGGAGLQAFPFNIGGFGSANQNFPGEIDEVELWTVDRAAADILGDKDFELVGNEAGLAGYWNFTDGTATDLVTATADGLFGGVSVVASDAPVSPSAPIVGDHALTRDGTTSYVDMGDATPLKITGPLTVETWFRTTQAVGDFVTLMGKWHTGASNASYGLSWSRADGLGFVITDTTNAVVVAGDGLLYNDGLWHHAAGVWDGAQALLYVDGDLADTAVGAGSPIADTALPFILGSDNTFSPERYFAGDMDEVRVWSVARTRAQIRDGMNTPPLNTEPGLEAHWTFDDGTATDVSLNALSTVNAIATTATPIASVQYDVVSLAFGAHDLGVESASLGLTITSTGAEAMLVNGLSVSDPSRFTLTAPGTPLPLNPDDVNSSTSVTFTASGVGIATSRIDVDHDARGPRFITLSGVGQVTPPTGDLADTKLVFAREVADTIYDIFVRDSDGTETNLTNDMTADQREPVWSPDGAQIAFSSDASGNTDIWVMDFDATTGAASNLQQLTVDAGSDAVPAWPPLGTGIVFHSTRTGNFDIFTVTVPGGVETQVTFDAASDIWPGWSPDGTQIVYSSTRGVGGAEDLFIVPAAGPDTAPIQVTATSDEEIKAAWSPDGTQLAFSLHPSGGTWDLYLIGVDGTGLAPLTVANSPINHENNPSWSPDGTRISYDSFTGGNTDVYAVNADDTGTPDRLTTDVLVDALADWSTFFAPAATTFVAQGSPMPGLNQGGAQWGDFDNDGDLDLLVSGRDAGGVFHLEVYTNTAGAIDPSPILLGTGIERGMVDWGDFDNDGLLDAFVSGWDGTSRASTVYRNDGGTFSVLWSIAGGAQDGDSAVGDFDNDGDLDVVIVGLFDSGPGSRMYENTVATSGDFQVHVLVDSGSTPLPGLQDGSVDAGDYDGDGYLDLLVAGASAGDCASIWRNDGVDGRTFRDIAPGLTAVTPGSGSSSNAVAWSDYDSDGDLDAVVSGLQGGSTPLTTIYEQNPTGVFTAVATPRGAYLSAVSWGDFDGDGDPDLVTMGADGAANTDLYTNDGANVFTEVLPDGVLDLQTGELDWGDVDGDGDLDLVVTGTDGTTRYSDFFVNTLTVVDSPPTAPSTPVATVVDSSSVTLSWGPAADTETLFTGLTYNLRVGTTADGVEIVSPMADVATGARRITAMGNAGQNSSITLSNLAPGDYYWGVQAVDAAHQGSVFTTEDTFTLGTTGAQAMFFDGVDDYVDMGNGAQFDMGGSVTVEAWFKTSQAVVAGTTLVGKWQTEGVEASYTLAWTAANGLRRRERLHELHVCRGQRTHAERWALAPRGRGVGPRRHGDLRRWRARRHGAGRWRHEHRRHDAAVESRHGLVRTE